MTTTDLHRKIELRGPRRCPPLAEIEADKRRLNPLPWTGAQTASLMVYNGPLIPLGRIW